MKPTVCALARPRLGGRIIVSLLLITAAAFCDSTAYDPDEGTLSSVKPKIPEPMVFDLVRPLGAEKGEFEVNSLFRIDPFRKPHRLRWAPEVEYAFLEGYGIEFELPMENGGTDAVKVALQGTLPQPFHKYFIQGWQAIGESLAQGGHNVDLLYLAGVRIDPKWSTFTMTGLRREQDDRSGYAFLGNYTLFYHASRSVVYGLETNWKGVGRTGRSRLLMPQIHWRGSRYNVQVGVGSSSIEGRTALQLGWRISREF